MRKVITYGTFDLFHYGHYFLLKRAKALGDYLIVGVSTDEMCEKKGKVCILPEKIRMQMVKDLSFVDEVILEHDMAQKVHDIKEYNIDVFCLGDDYKEIFPKMDEYNKIKGCCDIVFFERTPEVSTRELKEKLIKQLEMEKLSEET